MAPSIHTDNTRSHRFSAAGRTALNQPAGRRETQRSRWAMNQLLFMSSARKRQRKQNSILIRKLLVAAYEKQLRDSSENCVKPAPAGQLQQNSKVNIENIENLHNHSRSGLWGLLIFLGASAISLYSSKLSLANTLPVSIMDQLGSPPPVILINYIFGASTLSSLIIIAGRIYNNREPGKTSTHLLFRVFFFLLYFISGALSDYFNMVFISGLVVLGLQHYNVWNYYLQAIEINTGKCNSTDNTYNS